MSQDQYPLSLNNGLPVSASLSGSSAFVAYVSNAITTNSTANSSAYPTFANFSNSPALTFTPTISGTYKIYISAPIEPSSSGVEGTIQINNTSGGATLISNSQSIIYASTSQPALSVFTQATYSLTAGTSYVFDIQGAVSSGSMSLIAASQTSAVYMYAEGVGLTSLAPLGQLCSYNNTNGQSISSGSITKVTNWTLENDVNGIFNATTGVATIPSTGQYRIFFQCAASSSSGTEFFVYIYRNGSVLRQSGIHSPGGYGDASWPISVSLDGYNLSSGDTIDFRYYQNSGLSVNLYSTDTTQVYMSIVKVG